MSSSNRRQSLNSSRQADINLPSETSARNGANFKWTSSSIFRLLELYDQAADMNNYRIKDPTPFGKQFMVEQFNKEFQLDITYKFFKEKLDTIKKKYKKYKELLSSTGISVDLITSEIDASESCQRREEMRNEETNEDMLYEDTNGGEMSDDQDPETQHNEEIYRVNIDDETRPSNEFIRAQPRQSSVTVDSIQILGSSSKTRKYFSKTISQISFTREWFTRKEFQRQSLQQLRPNSFDQDDYNDFDVAVKIFESMGLPNDTKFYWACINEFKEDTFWRKYFIDRDENTFEEKVQFLQALSGFTRDDQYMGKRLSSGKPFGSPSSGGVHSGSPSSGGNNSWGQTVNGQWGKQPRAPQWGTPPSSHQWGTPPTSNQWVTFSHTRGYKPIKLSKVTICHFKPSFLFKMS
uniref:Myb/SANT-like domain-containing protein n=1 Tax=Brassica oleracea var. oleracea TaxID=109376 RepID=A0A0D3CIM3_BRAOL